MSQPDVLNELEGLAPLLPAAVEARRLGDSLTKALHVLKNIDHQVDRMEALIRLSAATGFAETPLRAEMLDEARDTAFDVGEALESAEVPSDLEKAVSRYERELGTAINNLDRNLSQHWRSVVQRQFEPLLAIGNLLNRIDPNSDLGKSLMACGSDAKSTPDSLGGRALFERVTKLLQVREGLQERRREELGEGDVATFVNALAEDSATLAMVTPEVRGWLAENDALGKLKVRPAI